MIPPALTREVEAWARGRNPWVRWPLLAVLALILLAYLRDPNHSSIFDGLNLVVHEAGHMFCFWFGELLAMAGGTLFELAIPVAVGWMFYRQRDFFGIAVVLFWLGTALFHVGVYVADARAQTLNLVSTGPGEPIHDWYYLLAHFGLLRQDRFLGGAARMIGVVCMGSSLAAGAWMLTLMRRR